MSGSSGPDPAGREPGPAALAAHLERLGAGALVVVGHGNAEPDLALTDVETTLLDRLVPDKDPPPRKKTLSVYLTKIARLGGYLARASDPPPGNTVMWRGLSRLTDIKLGAMHGAELVGN